MNKVWHIAGKELLQTRRDKLAALFTIVLPVVFTLFLGLLFGGGDESAARLPLAVVDEDGTPVAQKLIDGLESSPLLELEPMAADEIDAAVQEERVAAGIIIPEGYGAEVEQAARSAGEVVTLPFIRLETSSGAQSVYQAIQAVVGQTNVRLLVARTAATKVATVSGAAVDDALLASADSLAATALASPVVGLTTGGSGAAVAVTAGGFDQASTGALVNWVLFSLLTVATGLAWERRQGLLRRLTTTGVRGSQIVGGKVLAMLAITFLQQLFLVLLGRFAFGVDYFQSPLALLMVMVTLSLFAASAGLLISSVFRSEQAVIATTVISAQLLAALAGAWFPLEITSATFSRVAHFLPTAWVMDSLHGIILKDWGVVDVLGPLGFVWIWIVVLFGVAVWRFRPE